MDCPNAPNAGADVVAVCPKGAPKAVAGFCCCPNKLIDWFCGAGWPNDVVPPPNAGAAEVAVPNAGVVDPNNPPEACGAATPNGLA